MKERRKSNKRRNILLLGASALLFLVGGFILFAATLKIPDLSDFGARQVAQSTKIYDRTGQVLLYDLAGLERRTQVPFDQISQSAKDATIAIEDRNFYTHGGLDYTAIGRALLKDVSTLSFDEGGSTITQQVVKNSILTNDKTPTRKLKEAILAYKLDKSIPKDQILDIYLNEIPYGGNIYGIEEASEDFFGVKAVDLDLAQSAYLASMIQAPSHYSPYGPNVAELNSRKNLVLDNMLAQGLIDQAAHDAAKSETVEFRPKANSGGIKAPHFVFFVINYLAQKYGEDALYSGGLKVITTLDYTIQSEAEALAAQYGDSNQKQYDANNNAIVVIDPKTGDILSMVGSRDYYNTAIDGNFNVAAAPNRQPGSTFKPFVYSTLFEKGYTPETVMFDAPTQFTPTCAASDLTTHDNCYSPVDYDGEFRGPITIRNALAQSINVPAVEGLYLAGINDSLDTAHAMGITSLNDRSQIGLSLVLGSGEVSLLDMTSAYGVFANDGVRNPYQSVLEVDDSNGQVLEQANPNPSQVLPSSVARQISSILDDNTARIPAYGAASPLYIPTREVAVKTGTTNDSVDAWTIGYTPNIVVGAWVGNSNNKPMTKQVAGYIVAPLWRALMDKILPTLPVESFGEAPADDPTLKPILIGNWQQAYAQNGVHSILYWVDKSNPLGPAPLNPYSDPQYSNWEYAVQSWAASHPLSLPNANPQPTYVTDPTTGLPMIVLPPTQQTQPPTQQGQTFTF